MASRWDDRRVVSAGRPETLSLRAMGAAPGAYGQTTCTLLRCRTDSRGLAGAIPAAAVCTPQNSTELPGLTASTWVRAIALAGRHLCPGGVRRVHMDNGIGLAPNSAGLPRSGRYALSLGATCVFNAPGQPWRNGRLERFHWTMDKEFWRDKMPPTMAGGLTDLTGSSRERLRGTSRLARRCPRTSGTSPSTPTVCLLKKE